MTLQAGFDPLLRSISDGDLMSLKRLFDTGQYSVNEEVWYYSEDEKNYVITPLYWAVKLEQREICRYLLKNGADPYRHMVYEYFPLHEACNKGNCGILQEFIEAGCNLDKRNCDGDTPLHIACLRGHTECIRLLLGAGANRHSKNNKGQSPLQVAQFDQQMELYRLFETERSSPTRPQLRDSRNRMAYTSPGRRSSFSSSHPHIKQPRPLSYHSTTQDDTVIHNRIKSMRPDVTRTFSFSGSNHLYNICNTHQLESNSSTSRNETQHLRKQRLLKNSSQQRPSYLSHDSQLVLPTQILIPDPRRTQTCHEFQSLPAKPDSLMKSPSPELPLTPDDIEVDAIHPRQSSGRVKAGRVRVKHMVQCINPSLKSRDVAESDTNSVDGQADCMQKVLYSIHREMGFTEDEYSAIDQLLSDRENVCFNRPSSTRLTGEDLEYVWGCDYELVKRHVQINRDIPLTDHAELNFHVRLDEIHNSHCKNREALLKVIVQLFNCMDESNGKFDVGHGHEELCREGRIMSSVSPHPNIAKLFHHCMANSRPFERFTRQFYPDEDHQKVKMYSQCSLLFTEYFSTSLDDIVNRRNGNPRFGGVTEQSLQLYLAQLLLVMTHLNCHKIILGCISPSRIFVEKNHIHFADFAFAFDLSETSSKYALKSWLSTVPEEVFLTFPPELCQINDMPLSSLDESSDEPLDVSLGKCNVYCVGRIFQEFLSVKKTLGELCELRNLSEPFQYLLRNLTSDEADKRFSTVDATLFCLTLIFGPVHSNCNTLEECQEWLMTETFHLYLQPTLKGHPTDYQRDIQTKLLFIFLCLVTPEKLLSIIKTIAEINVARC